MDADPIERERHVDAVVHQELAATLHGECLHGARKREDILRRKVALSELDSGTSSLQDRLQNRNQRTSVCLMTIRNEEYTRLKRRHEESDSLWAMREHLGQGRVSARQGGRVRKGRTFSASCYNIPSMGLLAVAYNFRGIRPAL